MIQSLNIKPREIIGFTTTVVSVTITVILWTTGTFQSKTDAKDWRDVIEARMSKLENELTSLRRDLTTISNDTQYIRGRLEPRGRDDR